MIEGSSPKVAYIQNENISLEKKGEHQFLVHVDFRPHTIAKNKQKTRQQSLCQQRNTQRAHSKFQACSDDRAMLMSMRKEKDNFSSVLLHPIKASLAPSFPAHHRLSAPARYCWLSKQCHLDSQCARRLAGLR